VNGDLVGSGSGHDAAVFQGVLDGAEPVVNSVL
jgi:hypothetical protein